ncbi:membrane protein [Bradyrhizobium sp. CCBAU 45389]|nr:membrane protein [Bradyrhizobium sp. CCBAU 45389]
MVGLIVAAAVIGICLIPLWLASDFLVDWLWFSSIGYLQVFWTTIGAKAVVFLAVWTGTAVILWLNGWLALRFARRPSTQLVAASVWSAAGNAPPDLLALVRDRLPWPRWIAGGAALLALLVASAEVGNWGVFLRFVYQLPYGADDPLYNKDIGFYLFSLPAYILIKNWMMLALVLSALFAAAIYWVHGDIEYDIHRRSMSPTVIAHCSALLGLLFAVKAWSYFLDRYLLLYGDNGVVVGASYTDVHMGLPALWLMIGLSVIAALAAWANLRVRTYRLPAAAFLLVVIGSFVLSGVVPVLFRQFFVRPSELELERPYIERNIALTRQAYNLDRIAAKPFAAEQKLSSKTLDANKATIDNIRLWDWQPLSDTYAQLQEIRTYYKFHHLDVDRYWLDGAYQSVMISARELGASLLPPNAQTWVNRHVLFTHGNGAVMSPVTRKSTEGLPLLYLRDIPPVADGGPKIHEPRIYYGERSDDYVIVKGSTPEFDYPKGKDNVYAAYDGTGGVPIGAMVWRGLFAYYFNDPNLLLSSYVTADSRIMIRRNIGERVQTIAPFLRLDHDPYLVISNGRMFWMQDAYTVSSYFPSAQPAQDQDLNYIRNSVKVTVDAYNGTVDFYLMDTGDPIAATWRRIFPDLFKPFSVMPADLQRHIRYPEDLFLIQAQLYQSYHMEAADVFYNREDLWQFPRQPGGGGVATMAPYYIIMRLPGEPQAEFFLMLPMVPSRRDNMIAWLAARCDEPDYGKLIVYEFPKEKLVYGPFQIEARINQSTEISQQITLWNQMGSRVIRGANLLVIPIENSILYVTPLYLRAEHGHLPELKRVIAAYGEHVVMKETLDEALSALFTEPGAVQPVSSTKEKMPVTRPSESQAREALDRYNQAVERLKSGDWKGFGTQFDAMRELLEEMNRRSTGH